MDYKGHRTTACTLTGGIVLLYKVFGMPNNVLLNMPQVYAAVK